MAKFKKTMLGARTYHSPDGTLDVTQARLKHWADTFAKFRAAHLAVPIGWGHADDPKDSQPVKVGDKRRRLPQDTVGYLEQFSLTPDGDSAELTINVPREEDAEKVKNNLAELSPVVFETWKDGDGQEWTDCITHVDLVQHPVDQRQSEFQPVACALRLGLDIGKPVIYRLQGEDKDMPEDKKPPEESEVNNEGDRLKKVLDALAGMQIVLSDDTNEENFLQHLEQALLTATAMGAGEGPAEEPMEITQPEFAMSLDKQKPTASDRQLKYLAHHHRGTVATRLSALVASGQCTPAEYKSRQPAVKAIRLALDDDGNAQPSNLETWIASREAVPKGTFWDPETRTRLLRMEVVERPEQSGEALTPEQADKVADEILRKR